ncbi:MAG: hypothetical protein JKY65_03585 [Planctomycetes bacterium]|nr:hypothetical protein [Planctomycetota bacterium]
MNDRPSELVVSQSELRRAAKAGGPLPLINEKLGPGKYALRWIGPAGNVLHVEQVEIPDLEQLARRSTEERVARLEAQAAESRARRREERRRQARDQAERRLGTWRRGWSSLVMGEAASRRRWIQGLRLEAIRGRAPERILALLDAQIGDPPELRREVTAFLAEQAEDLLEAPWWVITGALDDLLPQVPDERFVPWTALWAEVG